MAQMLFNPSSFTASGAKPMPVILVLDNSGSMSGEKIDTLNVAVHDMLQTFKGAECQDVAFRIAIVTFGTGIHLLQEMESAATIQWHDIPISSIDEARQFSGKWDDPDARGTPLGATFKIIKSLIEDKTVVPSRAYRPAVILVSDGHPTDGWQGPLTSFTKDGRSSKCDRWAMAIGRDADAGVLGKFIEGTTNDDGTQRKLLYARDARTLRDNFKFITMSLTNTVAVASKSKVLTQKPITVKPTEITEHEDNPALMRVPDQTKEKEEVGSGFEW